jgi:microcystin-dependent protein
MGQGPGLSNYAIGQAAGTENVTLLVSNLPAHNHPLNATTTTANSFTPAGNLTAKAPAGRMYTSTGTPSGNLNAQSCSMTGGSQPHPNLMPALCVSFIIALYGIFPSRS